MRSVVFKRALSLTNYPFPVFRTLSESRTQISFSVPPNASTIIGSLIEVEFTAAPPSTAFVLPGNEEEPIDPESNASNHTFIESQLYLNKLHENIAAHYLCDPTIVSQAEHVKNGWLHIPDNRMFSPFGKVPDPEDIFGTVLVKEGKLVPNTYQRMPTHRLCSSNGLFQLTEYMHKKLVNE